MGKEEKVSSGGESEKIRRVRGGYPNPAEHGNPDPATMREQWRYAVRQYSRWYSHAWGTAILAGLSFFALGWFVKGSNPLPSLSSSSSSPKPDESPKP